MTLYEELMACGEYYAAGLAELDGEPILRYSNAVRRFLENAPVTPYDGGRLFPCGACPRAAAGCAARPDYSFTYSWNPARMKERSEGGYALMAAEDAKIVHPYGPHMVGGAGYTHCFPNYRRILREGLIGYRARVSALPEGDFRRGLLLLMDGIEAYRQRCLCHLREAGAPDDLIRALENCPLNPPENVYEALVGWNFIYYVDGCDDIGAVDRNLLPYWKGEDVTDLLHELFTHVDVNNGWSGPLGPEYNGITVMAIRAIANGRRPNLQLLVKPDMPDEVWEAAYGSLGTSCGQPALYNYAGYMRKLRSLMPEIPDADWARLAFGGCTETMLEGISSVGSDDAGINTALILSDCMRQKLADCATFEEFFDAFRTEARRIVADTMDLLNEYRRTRAKYRPQPLHTLFVDDCIEKMRDFNDDGPRWGWSVMNVAGMINVIDSMSVIRTLIYDEKKYTAAEFLEKLDARDEQFLADAKRCPMYGVADERVDSLGHDVAAAVYDAFGQRECYPRGRYYPVSNQFTTYEGAGKDIAATPDGRCCGAPLCDSLAPIHGNDVKGPTAMLNSVAALPLDKVIGTPITNIRMKKEHLDTMLKPLVLGFFAKGGMQLQVSCLSREEILDAMAHPENHQNLVVRIGGYSEYFNRLSPVLQQTVLERTEY